MADVPQDQDLRGEPGSSSAKSNISSFHSFMLLPPELRDEIYKHILYTPPHSSEPLFYNTRYQPYSLNLSILRASKQIFHEASRILYGHSVFPIRIARNEARGVSGDRIYYISQEAPWEHLCYQYHGLGGHFYSPKTSGTLIPPTYLHPNEAFPPPAFGNLIRNIRIDYIDNRPFNEAMRTEAASMQLLLLSVDRLTSLLANKPGEDNRNVDIYIFSHVLDTDPDLIRSMPGPIDYSSHTFLAQSARRTIYEGLIDTIWPLTRGPWKSSINVPCSLKEEFPGLLEERLQWCNEQGLRKESEVDASSGRTSLWDLWIRERGQSKYAGGGDKGFDPMNEDDL